MRQPFEKEKDVLGQILNYCKVRHLCVWRMNTGKFVIQDGYKPRFFRVGINGQADITGLLPDGRRLEIECKGTKGRQSNDQKAFQAMIEKHHGVYLLAHSLDEFVAAITPYLGGTDGR